MNMNEIVHTIVGRTLRPTPNDHYDACVIASHLQDDRERKALRARLNLGSVDAGADGRAYVFVAGAWLDVEIAEVLV